MFTKIVTAVAAMGTVLFLAPNASADDASFLAALHASGQFDGSDDAAVLALGHDFCDAEQQSGYGVGISPRQAAMLGLQGRANELGITAHSPRAFAFDDAVNANLCRFK